MTNKDEASVAFDKMLQASREKKKHEQLAQELLGKRRSSTPSNTGRSNLGASLASRVGVNKRPTSLSRSSSSQTRLTQSATQARTANNAQRQNARAQPNRPQTKRAEKSSSNLAASSNGSGLNIKGAAGGPCAVFVRNLEPGTTAADIESVMRQVSENLTYCKVIESTQHSAVAEIGFADRAGAEKVISTFNNKKADGRVLFVEMKTSRARDRFDQEEQIQHEPETFDEDYDDDTAMDLDQNAKSREAENKLREERRGGADRGRQDVFPSGPRGQRGNFSNDYYHGDQGQRNGQGYQDGRYGFNGGNYGGRGRGYDDRRGHGRGGWGY